MAFLYCGLALFVIVHLFPNAVAARADIIGRIGEAQYKIAFSALSFVAFGLIFIGKTQASYVEVWLPPAWLHLFVLPIMYVAFYCLAATYIPSNLPRVTRHPMLWAVTLWSIAHLLVNSDLASIAIFATFGTYALIDMYLANRRGVKKSTRRYPISMESMPIAIGGIGLIVMFLFHVRLFGVAPGIH